MLQGADAKSFAEPYIAVFIPREDDYLIIYLGCRFMGIISLLLLRLV